MAGLVSGGEIIMDCFGFVVFFAILTTMAFLAYKNSTIAADKKICTNFKYYPRHYAMPPRWLRHFFSLPKRPTGKYLIARLYFAIAHIVLGLITTIIFLLTKAYTMVASVYFLLYVSWIVLDQIVFIIYFYIFKTK